MADRPRRLHPEFGSPAFDAGDAALAVDANGQPFTTDQRGTGFPRVVSGSVNIGAVENLLVLPIPIIHIQWGHGGVVGMDPVMAGIGGTSTQLPPGRKLDLPWIGINSFRFNFNEPVLLNAADVMVQSARGMNYGRYTLHRLGHELYHQVRSSD